MKHAPQTELCKTCGRPIPHVRLGVMLTRTQAAIFDAVKRAGKDGIAPRDLRGIVYHDRQTTPQLLGVHVRQMNDRLAETNYVITCGRGRYSTYRLVKS